LECAVLRKVAMVDNEAVFLFISPKEHSGNEPALETLIHLYPKKAGLHKTGAGEGCLLQERNVVKTAIYKYVSCFAIVVILSEI
jgi:hypothetical protein